VRALGLTLKEPFKAWHIWEQILLNTV
jgi:hypothetical protein